MGQAETLSRTVTGLALSGGKQIYVTLTSLVPRGPMRRRLAGLFALPLLCACGPSSSSQETKSDTKDQRVIVGAEIYVDPRPRVEGHTGSATMVFPKSANLELSKELVRLGFGLGPNGSLSAMDFRSNRMSTVEIAELIRLIKRQDRFEGEPVAQALLGFRGRVAGAMFGRERAPVVYIQLPTTTGEREDATAKTQAVSIPERERQALVDEIREVFVDQLSAAVVTVNNNEVRIAWR
jgi:hypothetical protein